MTYAIRSGLGMAAAGVPMHTLQEWMGHRDIEATQRYADYAPSTHEAAMVAAAFGVDQVHPGRTSRGRCEHMFDEGKVVVR
jgi:hypothetical protein